MTTLRIRSAGIQARWAGDRQRARRARSRGDGGAHLLRETAGKAFVYSPRLTRSEFERAMAERYRTGLVGLPLALPVEALGARHVSHLYVVRTPERDDGADP